MLPTYRYKVHTAFLCYVFNLVSNFKKIAQKTLLKISIKYKNLGPYWYSKERDEIMSKVVVNVLFSCREKHLPTATNNWKGKLNALKINEVGHMHNHCPTTFPPQAISFPFYRKKSHHLLILHQIIWIDLAMREFLFCLAEHMKLHPTPYM